LTIVTVVGSFTLIGCSWINPRSGFERDPMVMSHLSRSSDLAFNGPSKEGAGPALIAGRPGASASSSSVRLASHAVDFRWVLGRIERSVQDPSQLAVQFEDVQGEAREIPLEPHPSLQMVRPGDKVMVEGDLVSAGGAGRQMRVRRVAMVP
jgi:hypothetical protein